MFKNRNSVEQVRPPPQALGLVIQTVVTISTRIVLQPTVPNKCSVHISDQEIDKVRDSTVVETVLPVK